MTDVKKVTGRLELTWSNKDRRLLAHDDVTYEWVDPADWRVSEVRLLDEVATYGSKPQGNLLVHGDALHALEALISIPEYSERYRGKVKLCYIDPPFNTGQTFQQYDDNLEHSVWLTMLRDRLEQIYKLLSPDGSVWVHLDDAEQHRARCVLDEVFGSENFVATIIWQKTTSGRNDQNLFSVDQDYLIVYARDVTRFRPHKVPHTDAANKAYRNPDDDPRGPWREVDYKGPKTSEERPNLYYPLTHPVTGEEVWPRRERVWAYGREEHERHLREDLLWWGKTGNYTFPKLKKFLSERSTAGTPPRTLWMGDDVDTTRRAKKEIQQLFSDVTPFATPKPERLLRRIVQAATDPGDIVLDCFAGSGTTAAVAHKMGRRWVTVELSGDTLDTFIRPRLRKVIDGADPGGITDAVEWTGGGGFTEAKVAPSMFDDADGNVVLSDWATNGQLAAAVAAQLKFPHDPDGPFAGRKGRTRLVVLDGMLTSGIAEYLVTQLDERETLVAVAMTLEEGVAEHLRELRPGSRARKVPRDLARSGKLPPRLVRLDRIDNREDR